MRWETKKNPRFVYRKVFAYLPVMVGTVRVWWEYVYVVVDTWLPLGDSYHFTEEEAKNAVKESNEAWKEFWS